MHWQAAARCMPPLVLHTALEPQGVGLQGSISSTTAAAAKRQGVQRRYLKFLMYFVKNAKNTEKINSFKNFSPVFGTLQDFNLFCMNNRFRDDPHKAIKKLRRSDKILAANKKPFVFYLE
jgi:hypothetical protein